MTAGGEHEFESIAGVPLGGVGAGCLEMGRDGIIRNVTINNNRLASTRIPLADGAFLAIRTKTPRGPLSRILQPTTSIPFESAGVTVSMTPKNKIQWEGLYPASTYALSKSEFPLQVGWRGITTIIPYDTEAAMLPMTIFAVQVKNTTQSPRDVSTLMNWENLRGCMRTSWPEDRGRVGLIVINEKEQVVPLAARTADNQHWPLLGLSFGMGAPINENAVGDYSLAAAPEAGTHLTFMGWDGRNLDEIRRFWESFHDTGNLPDTLSENPTAYCGAVCASRTLEAGATTQFVFIFTWSCPRFVVEGEDLGNGYSLKHADSVSVAAYGLEHHKYFLKAISTLRQRFVKSSLPRWFSKMLLNDSYVFSTNTLLTRDGEFAMMESPETGEMGALNTSFYSSLGTLLFFPAYAHSELGLFAKETSETGLAADVLGAGTVHKPSAPEGTDGSALNPKLVLLACRNYKMTGNLARLIDIYPALRKMVERAMTDDNDNDGFPDLATNVKTFSQSLCISANAYAGGLWIAAYEAMAYLARALKHSREADQYIIISQKARASYERMLWNEELGYYQFMNHGNAHSDMCTASQLAGQWAADFLALDGAKLDTQHVVRALTRMRKSLARSDGVLEWSAPEESRLATHAAELSRPNLAAVYYACMQIYHGNAGHGLDVLKTVYKNLHLDTKRSFNQPFQWDLAANAPSGPCQDRHMASLAMWHALFALEGFLLCVPDNTMYLRPNLPEGINYLNAPVFTPMGLGELTYHVQNSPDYTQTATIEFESPIHIQHIKLAVPKEISDVSISIVYDSDAEDARSSVEPGEVRNTAHIELPQAFFIRNSLSITVKEKRRSVT